MMKVAVVSVGRGTDRYVLRCKVELGGKDEDSVLKTFEGWEHEQEAGVHE